LVRELNVNPHVHGVLVQLPLPKHISSEEVLDALAPQKDVDGFGPHNAGALFTGRQGLRPCTPLGIMRLLDESADAAARGARARGGAVEHRGQAGRHAAARAPRDGHAGAFSDGGLAAEVGAADVLVAAVGKAEMIRGAWVKPGATVIDVGINRNAAGKLVASGVPPRGRACPRDHAGPRWGGTDDHRLPALQHHPGGEGAARTHLERETCRAGFPSRPILEDRESQHHAIDGVDHITQDTPPRRRAFVAEGWNDESGQAAEKVEMPSGQTRNQCFQNSEIRSLQRPLSRGDFSVDRNEKADLPQRPVQVHRL